jgi:hypothetical protein
MAANREFLPEGVKRESLARAEGAAAPALDYPSTLVGTAGNVTVYYATSLGTQGQTLATSMLGLVTGPYGDMEEWFGIDGGPVTVVVAPLSSANNGTGGAYHRGCDFTSGGTLYLDATFALPNAIDTELVLYIAELSESFMGAQGAGWGCGFSNGEGLSRFSAALDTPPGSFPSWGITGPSWVSANYPDWVTTTEQTDGDYASTGCAVLYIYWMLSQGYSKEQVTQAGGATLADNYKALTGKATAYADLKAAVQAKTVTSDNPWGGLERQLWHTIRNADGSWQSAFGLIEGQESNNPGPFGWVACGGVGNQLQLTGQAGWQLWHTIRNADGSWQPFFGLIEGQESNNPGPFNEIGCAGVGDQLQVVGVVNGQLWHTIRNADGSWQSAFGLIEGQESNNPGRFRAVSCAGVGDQLQVVGIVGGQLWHTIRNADGSWQPFFGLIEGQESNNPGVFSAVGCAGVGDQLQVVGIVGGQLWHTIRNADGSWQSAFGLVEGQESNNPGVFSAVGCAGVGDQLQVVGIV